ncbi:MAG: LPXTG cell wall anchor domain-containing protein [Clostridium sp.]|uniref:Uncharacterized protein n=1 Tax=Clostridium tertium TaxID=1559 RepID=A0A6N3FPS6_9CLOT|nr:LPXTG cell wall anchor domain-containing protein [Clostridium sp.]MDU3546446.1 LPXTG cell wall anchor domain-containing protein [Clostridium sp.]
MKIFKTFILAAFLILINISLAFGEVNISVEESKVSNLIYEIEKDGVPCIKDGSIFYLKNSEGVIIAKTKSEASIIVFENIPFGDYIIESDDKDFSYNISVNKDYLDSQHIVKIIDIGKEDKELESNNVNNLPSTGIESNTISIAFIIIVIGIYITLFRKRKEVV